MVYTLVSVKIYRVQHDEFVKGFIFLPQITPASCEWSQFSIPQPSKAQSTKRDSELKTTENTKRYSLKNVFVNKKGLNPVNLPGSHFLAWAIR